MGTPTQIIQSLLHPPLGLMKTSATSPTVLQPSYSGRVSIPARAFPFGAAFGFTYTARTSPPGAGRSTRVTTIFEEPWFNFATMYKLADGSQFLGDFVEVQRAAGYFLWAIALPQSLEVDILPGWTLGLSWIIGV